MNALDHAWITAIIFILFLIFTGVTLYVVYFKLGEIENHLKNCRVVMANKRHWSGWGPMERTQRLIWIVLIFDFNKLYHNPDELDMSDIRNFPKNLKRWILIPHYCNCFLCVMLVAHWIWEKWFLPW